MPDLHARVRRELARAAHTPGDRVAFYRATEAALARVVPADGTCWITLDPTTGLFTNHFSEALPAEGFRLVCRNEYGEEDVNKFVDLTVAAPHVGILSEATGGVPERSPRYRTVIAPFGLHGELRVSFANGSSSWGCAILLRGEGRDFGAEDAGFVASVVQLVGHGFRTALAPVTLDAVPVGAAPGLVLLDDLDRITAVTPPAELWLEALGRDEPAATGPAPAAVLAIAATARAQALADDAEPAIARARARTVDGRWVVLHGSVLETGDGPRTAVIVEPAEPGDLAPLVVEALGLTPREQQVVRAVLLGWSTDRIADALHLSPYTVQDHLKSVFTKAGVRSRRDLAARIFFQHYAPRLSDEPALAPSGWLRTEAT